VKPCVELCIRYGRTQRKYAPHTCIDVGCIHTNSLCAAACAASSPTYGARDEQGCMCIKQYHPHFTSTLTPCLGFCIKHIHPLVLHPQSSRVLHCVYVCDKSVCPKSKSPACKNDPRPCCSVDGELRHPALDQGRQDRPGACLQPCALRQVHVVHQAILYRVRAQQVGE
jgi:hypothetical protein